MKNVINLYLKQTNEKPCLRIKSKLKNSFDLIIFDIARTNELEHSKKTAYFSDNKIHSY